MPFQIRGLVRFVLPNRFLFRSRKQVEVPGGSVVVVQTTEITFKPAAATAPRFACALCKKELVVNQPVYAVSRSVILGEKQKLQLGEQTACIRADESSPPVLVFCHRTDCLPVDFIGVISGRVDEGNHFIAILRDGYKPVGAHFPLGTLDRDLLTFSSS